MATKKRVIIEDTYADRFRKGVKVHMANLNIDTLKEASIHLAFPYQTLYKIMDGSQNPTVEHGQQLCEICLYSAEWLFMGKGSLYSGEQATLNQIHDIVIELVANRKSVSKTVSKV